MGMAREDEYDMSHTIIREPLDSMSNDRLKTIASEATARLEEVVGILEARAKRKANRPELPKDWQHFTFCMAFTRGGKVYYYTAQQRGDGQIDITGRRSEPFKNFDALLDWLAEESATTRHMFHRLIRAGANATRTPAILSWDE